MGDSYLGFVLALAFIASCHVFPTANGAEGLWKSNFDSSAATIGGYLPGTGNAWLCRYIDEKGLARVGAYLGGNSGCKVHSIPTITDMDKVKFLTTDNGAHSYAWIKKKDVKSLSGAISAGSASSQQQTYACRATFFDSQQRLVVSPGTYYAGKGLCVIPHPDEQVIDIEILFDLYSMCDDNVNTEHPDEYKNGNWTDTFDKTKAVEAGQQELPGEMSYVCRVRKDSKVFLGKHKSFEPSCGYVDGDKVIWGAKSQEVLVSTPSNFFGWAPRANGNIAAGTMYGYGIEDGGPVYLCRAFYDVGGKKAPLSPGGLSQSRRACVTPIENKVTRNENYEVLVDMRRTCDQRGGHSRTSWGVPPSSRPRQQTPISAVNSRSEGWGSNDADAEEYLATGLNGLKLALDSYASA